MYGVPNYHNIICVDALLTSNADGYVLQLNDNPIIRQPNVLITGVEIYTASQFTKTPAANTVITEAAAKGIVLTLQDDKNQYKVFEIPVLALNPAVNNGVSREFEPFRLVMQNSYLKVTDAAVVTANRSVYIAFNYIIDKAHKTTRK
jgi:hypothetical protein